MVTEIIIVCATFIVALCLYLAHNYFMWKVKEDKQVDNRIDELIKTIEVLRAEKQQKQEEVAKASANETAAFFDILKDPTKLYEEE